MKEEKMKFVRATCFFLATSVVLLSACTLPTPTPKPTCPTSGLLSPDLSSPGNGASVNTTNPTLSWHYPDPSCDPQGYRIDLSVDPLFADTSLSGGTGNPSTNWGPGSPLVNCQLYYWRVAPINNITLGPFSSSRSFRVNVSGTCSPGVYPHPYPYPSPYPFPYPPASAAIGGVVWEDFCIVPELGPTPVVPPEGCINLDGSLVGNGIREPGEPGIAGVKLDLHSGTCAAPVVASTTTDAAGHYNFDGLLAFGPYCVSLTPLDPVNVSVLIPGGFTFPTHDATTGEQSATVASGTVLTDADFGWQFQFGPSITRTPTAAPAGASGSPYFKFAKNAFCREGPSQVFRDITAIPAGEMADIFGRSEDDMWFFVLWKKYSVKCWISKTTGEAVGDLKLVPVLSSPHTPTPTHPPVQPPQRQRVTVTATYKK
jgi:hypothetical protein